MPDTVDDIVRRRRKYHASMTTLPATEVSEDEFHPPPPPPPPPPPAYSSNVNNKVRLEPQSMRIEGDERGLPHVDAVVHPIMRELGVIRPSPEQIREAKLNLKPSFSKLTGIVDMRSSTHEPSTNSASDNSDDLASSNISRQRKNCIDETPNKQKWLKKTKSQLALDSLTKQFQEMATEMSKLRDEKHQLSRKVMQHELSNQTSTKHNDDDDNSTIRLAKTTGTPHALNFLEQDVLPPDYVNKPSKQQRTEPILSDESSTVFRTKRLDTWVKSAEQADPPPSILGSKRRSSSPVLVVGKPQKERRGRSKTRTRSNSSKRSKSEARSESLPRSLKSVLFHFSDADEQRSETNSDNVTECIQVGEDYITRTADKLVIHGPYIDDELNVFHELCLEYTKAAQLTFAQRSFFSRTKPAHERVYGLIGSDKRSKWLNRRDWTSGMDGFKLLDYLFRKTIRSKTGKIKRPGLNIEYFDEGRTLSPERFKAIMKKAFDRRDELLKTVVGEIKPFTSIT